MNEKNDINEEFSINNINNHNNNNKGLKNNKDELNKIPDKYCFLKYFLISFIIISIIIVIGLLYLYITYKGEDRYKNQKIPAVKDINGYINCTYDIVYLSQNISILNEKFEPKNNIVMQINGTFYPFSKSFKFKSFGKTKINFIFNETINMDYMFYNISSLISLQIITEGNIEI